MGDNTVKFTLMSLKETFPNGLPSGVTIDTASGSCVEKACRQFPGMEGKPVPGAEGIVRFIKKEARGS